MKPLLSATLVLAFTACVPASDLEEFRSASPSRQGVEIKVPSSGGQALTADEVGQSMQPLLGLRAPWYELTRAITVVVNGGTAWVLKLCEEIIKYEPTTLEADQAVWGPHTDPLSPNTFKFTVTRADEGFDYFLEAKAKEAADSAYVKIISGHHVPGESAKAGQGSFTVDWDGAQTLPEHGEEIGKANFLYSRNAALDVTVGVEFRQVRDDQSGQRVDADYAFAQANRGDGSFEFVLHKDMTDLPNDTAALERLAVKSRWHQDGAGRCDVKLSQGDIATPVTLNECWNSSFAESFYSDSLGLMPAQGAESSCVFTPAEYTEL